MLGPSLALSALLFAIGVLGVVVRRNAIVVFMCIELMLNAVNLSFVAFSQVHGIDGQVMVFFVIAGSVGSGRKTGWNASRCPAALRSVRRACGRHACTVRPTRRGA